MRKYLKLLGLLIPSALYGQDIIYEGIGYNILGEHEVEVTYISGQGKYTGYVSIPKKITIAYPGGHHDVSKEAGASETDDSGPHHYDVTRIGNRTFKDCDRLISLQLPPTIVEIGREAIAGCSGLREITIPKNIRRLGDRAFENSHIGSRVIMDSLQEIGDRVFHRSNASDIILSSCRLKRLGKETFAGSTIERVFLPAGLTAIPENTFRNCRHLRHVGININSCLEEVGSNAFRGCRELNAISLPEIRRIGKNAFYGVNINSVLFSTITPPSYDMSAVSGKRIPTLILFPSEGEESYREWCPEMYSGKVSLTVEGTPCKWAYPGLLPDRLKTYGILSEGVFPNTRINMRILLTRGRDISLLCPEYYGLSYGFVANNHDLRDYSLFVGNYGTDPLAQKAFDSLLIRLDDVQENYLIEKIITSDYLRMITPITLPPPEAGH